MSFTEFHDKPKSNGAGTFEQPTPRIISSHEFIKGFVAPDFIWDGILQRGFLYSLTAATGSGKTAISLLLCAKLSLSWPIAGRDVAKGRVIILAGENSDDMRMRWLAMAERLPFNVNEIDVHFIDGVFAIPEYMTTIERQIEDLGGCALIVVDTSAAYFQGGEENNNAEIGNHARSLRALTKVKGSPCVLVLCHPTKNANGDNLLPRGGGAFVAEVDGNLTARASDMMVELHWIGKLRGPGFEPVHFELQPTTAEILKDSRGRNITTVIARDLSRQEAEQRLGRVHALEDQVILALDSLDNPSIAAIATKLGWIGATGEPQKSRVFGILKGLVADGLAEKDRHGRYKLTTRGEKEALRKGKTGLNDLAAETQCSNAER